MDEVLDHWCCVGCFGLLHTAVENTFPVYRPLVGYSVRQWETKVFVYVGTLNSCLPQRLACPLIPISLCQTVESPVLIQCRTAVAENRSSGSKDVALQTRLRVCVTGSSWLLFYWANLLFVCPHLNRKTRLKIIFLLMPQHVLCVSVAPPQCQEPHLPGSNKVHSSTVTGQWRKKGPFIIFHFRKGKGIWHTSHSALPWARWLA